MGDRFATIDMSSDVNPKPYLGAGVPLSVGGDELDPYPTQCGLGLPLYQMEC